MPTWLWEIWTDSLANAALLRPVDFARPTFIAIWIAIVSTPLKGVDRRDSLAGMVFALFALGSGVLLIFALPQKYVERPTFTSELVGVVLMLLFAFWRWFLQGNSRSDASMSNFRIDTAPRGTQDGSENEIRE